MGGKKSHFLGRRIEGTGRGVVPFVRKLSEVVKKITADGKKC
ncbi:hypothetical protein QJT29_05230 [Treponema pallidum]|uniref:Uncharacterized protein TP_0010 n=4 Tax=Treponema TaxID=157 RepID=Y010_TREPA|nr:hypothetical protein [Treponema pallidum]O83054.1 RecName: Full=Uncharacterized protein TP_0010 [Treponema pallidum subsp. pallidum str. Nichols]ABO37059.1 hypothetical protein [Treponema paraluiscuniculi]ACD70437.1 hypothetical protein TPASS_0010 [Treponema pallidum subsp. pallidum SS14]ADD72166.1 conserved hypothetical protein [Treponema pallidum subsp. pallidum str. Chicago]AEH39968.1 hypothetical protein TPCCA_0010 [Treponema paraluiscuniculi Cuniculi A]AAC65011.1 predicted coding regi